MSLATTYEEKNRIINDIFAKMAPDERKIMMRLMIKTDMKSFFETIWEEQRFLEEETGIDGAELIEATECSNTSEKAWNNGMEVNTAGQVSKEAENAYYLDEKLKQKQGNDKLDGFLGYVNSSCDDDAKNDDSTDETVLEPGSEMLILKE